MLVDSLPAAALWIAVSQTCSHRQAGAASTATADAAAAAPASKGEPHAPSAGSSSDGQPAKPPPQLPGSKEGGLQVVVNDRLEQLAGCSRRHFTSVEAAFNVLFWERAPEVRGEER